MTTSFTVNLGDLSTILEQIKVAERHAAGEDLATIIGADAGLLPVGLRTVDGSYNHLLPGTHLVGAADQLFPRLLPASFRLETDGDRYMIVRADVAGAPPGGITITNNNYDPTIAGSHSVADADLRIISNLIVDATLGNPAALEAALVLAGSTDVAADVAAVGALHAAAIAAAGAASSKAATSTAYDAAVDSAQSAQVAFAAVNSALVALRAGIAPGEVVDPADIAALTAGQSDLAVAIAFQQAALATLQREANVTPSAATDSALQSARDDLASFRGLQAALDAVGTALADGTTDLADIGLVDAAIASGGAAATGLNDHLSILVAGAAGHAGASQAASAVHAAAVQDLADLVEEKGLAVSSDGSLTIENRSPDIGLSPGFNGWMTFFGQFFDHGLDLVTKGGNGTVYIPLEADDPLYDRGQDGLVGPQQVRDADGNLVYDTNGAPVMHDDDGYGADGILGTVDDRPNFMALTRATTYLDPATGLRTETRNTTTPFIDQNQTYTSSASHQVFLREYALRDVSTDLVAGPVAVATGRLLDGGQPGSIANWGEVKAQAVTMLGIRLSDSDVTDVPKLVVDQYGKFTPGAHGFAQVLVNVYLVNDATHAAVTQGTFVMEGTAGGLDLAALPLPTDFTGPSTPPPGFSYQVSPVRTGHAFLDDIAHHAAPGTFDANGDGFKESQQIADLDIRDVDGNGKIDGVDIAANDHDVNADGVVDARDLVADDHAANTYDNEMLDAHFTTGDGRGNENIGLTAVHTIFHSEHNRLVEANKDTVIASGDAAMVNQWLLPSDQAGGRNAITQGQLDAISAMANPAAKAAAIDALNWDGERLFQAARFATEMQYQHLVFEEFARTIQPNVDPFIFTNSADLNPAIFAEFAHVVYRFGHSMLSDTVDRLDNNLNPISDDPQLRLIDAFLNPQAFTASGTTAAEAAGVIIRGMTRQIGGEIDEFVVEGVRSNLVGLPLDLAALNMARGRETGVPTFNDTRAILYDMTGDAQLKPYVSWVDFAANMKNATSVINFIAAYGQHESILLATTAQAKREAATLLVMGDGDDGDGVEIAGQLYTDRLAFLNANGLNTAGDKTWDATSTGLNGVDLWIGGLAEAKMEFGGMLGSTFNFIFEAQMENLQNGDRFYYLSRTQGMNLLNQLEPNTFADLVMRNTELGGLHSTHVSAKLFDTPDAIIELDPLAGQEDYNGSAAGLDPRWNDGLYHAVAKVLRDDPNTTANEALTHTYLKFTGGEHVVLGGSENADRMYGDKGIDTLWGDGGDDYLNAASEADQVFGGDGDDIIEDPFGDGDFLRGNLGNDVVVDSHGFGDVLFGDAGKDFVAGGSDVIEIFAGEGDDFVLGGNGSDTLLGNEGNDWIEGGEGFDGLAGENSELFFNSPIIGHDVLNGQGNDTDYDGESGDDIMVQGPGIQRNNGMLGFDWVIHKGDPNGGTVNLGVSRFDGQQALILRDRYDSVEGASGWRFDDLLVGTNQPTGAAGGTGAAGTIGGPATDSMLLSQNVALIGGLEGFLKLTPGALRGQTTGSDATAFDLLPRDTTVFNPQAGGDILLGGAGSDRFYGLAGNDLIDGDRWLNVRIEVHANKDGTGPLVTGLASVGADGSVDSLNEIRADLLAGQINPGQLQIVREIVTTGVQAGDVDVVTYAGSRGDYSIVFNANGTVTVTDNVIAPVQTIDPVTGQVIASGLLRDEGTDTLSNIEILRFTDHDQAGAPTGTFTSVRLADAITEALAVTDAMVGEGPGGTRVLTFTVQRTVASATAVSVAYATSDGTATSGSDYTAASGTLTFLPDELSKTITVQIGGDTVQEADETVILTLSAAAGAIISDATAVGTILNDDLVGDALANTLIAPTNGVRNGVTLDFTVDGAGGNDIITGGAGTDRLTGGTGRDTMTGGLGDDLYVTDMSADAVIEGVNGGLDTVETTSASYTLSANVENLTYLGGSAFTALGNAGDNRITGGSAADYIRGFDGNDVLIGAGGADRLEGQGGNDTYLVDDALAVVIERQNEGVDTVRTTLSTYRLGYNVEALLYTGSAGFTGTGNGLANVITGGAAADVLTGAAGGDTLTGGGGADTFTYLAATESSLAARDRILDFVSGADRIDLTAIDANARIAGNQAFAFIGAGAFTGSTALTLGQRALHAGELRFADGILSGDRDGDGIADFAIALLNDGLPVFTLVAGDLAL